MEITTVGIDLAKSIFQVHAVDAAGHVVVRKALRRAQVTPFFAKLPRCLIGMEACGTAHHWARELMKLGHDVRLMPPAYVKPYVKRGKTDANDAAAICEAVTRPSMRFVPVKSTEQQAALALHRTRDLLVKQRTQLVNMIRGLLAEFGIEMAWGLRHALELAARLSAGDAAEVPPLAQRVVTGLADQIGADSAHPTGEGVARLASGQRPVAAPGDDPGCRHRLGNRAGRLGERARALPLRAAVRGLVGPDTAAELQRRQGAPGPDLAHGRSLPAPAARSRHDLSDPAREGSADFGRPAAAGVAAAQASARGDCCGGQSHGAGRLGDHDPRRHLPRTGGHGRLTARRGDVSRLRGR
jgi:hypothetical protein